MAEIQRLQEPYAAAILDGPVEEVGADEQPVYEFALRLAERYYGDAEAARAFAEPMRGGSPGSVVFRLRPQRVVSWRGAEEA